MAKKISTTFGKLSPPHIGHQALGMQVMQYAKDNGMDHMIFTSRRHMKKLKNPRPYPDTPLSPEQKVKHIKRFLQTENVALEESPYSAIETLFNKGYDQVHIHLGSDRIEDGTGEKLKEKYGDKIKVIPFGEKRKEGEKGIRGASSTLVRKHAANNDFEQVRSMIPDHVSEEHAREYFDEVRAGLKQAQVELKEEVSAATRLKLSRIAKRNAKLRAAKRRARVKRRRNVKQLKGRAKQDIKNQLRHRYFKGSWQKLGFSSRARIDQNVNKRRKIADSMVRRIMPDVIRGENERLRRVSTRKESLENLLLPLLTEARIGQKKLGKKTTGANSAASRSKARLRKKKQRTKIESSKASGNVKGRYAIVKSKSGKFAGREMIVDKESINSNTMDVILAPDKFSIGAGRKLTTQKGFINTDSSIELYGMIKGEQKATIRKPKAAAAETKKSTKSKGAKKTSDKNNELTPEQKKARKEMMPKEPGKFDPEPGNIQPKKRQSKHCVNPTSHDAKIVEPGMALFANTKNGVSVQEQIKLGLVDEKTALAILKNPHASLHPALEKMSDALIKKYGSGVMFKVTGSSMDNVELNDRAKKGGITNKTSKTDVQVLDRKTKKVVDNASVKCGPGQASSGNWQDSYVALEWTVDNADEFGITLPEDVKKDVKKITDYLSGDEYGGYHRTERGPSGLYTQKGPFAGQDPGVTKKEKANKKLTDMLDKVFAKSKDLQALYTLAQITGFHKFKQGSDAIASTMIAVSHDGSQVKIAPVDLDLAKKCKIDIASRIKSNAVASTDQEKEWDQLKEQAKKKGKKLTDLDDFRQYSLRNTIRVVINEINLEQLKENFSPVAKLNGVKLVSLLLEKQEEPPPQPTDDEMKSNFDELKQLAEENPMEFLKIIIPLFDFDDLSPSVDWLDVIANEGYTFNRVFINGNEFRIPVQIPIDNPIPGMDVPALGEGLLISEKRNYRKEYDNYHSKPEQRKNRSKRVLARRLMMKLGKVKKGDGKDVDHKDGNPKNNGKSNLRVRSKSENRADND
jgi:hypothetical protein